jgi:hypothetical protein
MPVSPLQPLENKNKRRKARKWCLLEEETLRKGVEQYVILTYLETWWSYFLSRCVPI